MSQDNYRSIPDLVQALKGHSDSLESGALPPEQLDKMINDSRELYDRLIVLQYKAFEKSVKGEEVEPTPEPEPEAPKSNTFKIGKAKEKEKEKEASKKDKRSNGGIQLDFHAQARAAAKEEIIPRNQVNLIDAIQEEEKHRDPEDIAAEAAAEAEAQEAPQPVEEPAQPVVETPQFVEETPVPEPTPEPVTQPTSTVDPTLNEQIATAGEEPQTLGDRLKMQPIADLKKAIGINQKFLFMNDLFEGEHAYYHAAIDKLNAFANREEAQAYVGELKGKYSWDMESSSANSFVQLIERRYS